MSEAESNYLRLRERWHELVTDRDEPMRSARKDGLYDLLTRAWNRLDSLEKRCMGFHCRAVFR